MKINFYSNENRFIILVMISALQSKGRLCRFRDVSNKIGSHLDSVKLVFWLSGQRNPRVNLFSQGHSVTILDDIIFLNRRRFKTIKLNDRDNSSLLYRRSRRYKVIIYHFLKNIDDIK